MLRSQGTDKHCTAGMLVDNVSILEYTQLHTCTVWSQCPDTILSESYCKQRIPLPVWKQVRV